MSSTCCDAMREVEEKYDLPFVRPLFVAPKTLDLGVASLSVQLDKRKPNGNIDKKGKLTVYLNFCPFCGEKLRDIAVVEMKGEKDE